MCFIQILTRGLGKVLKTKRKNKMQKIKVIVEVNGEMYHFWLTEGTQEEAHEFTRELSMLIKKQKIFQ